MKDDEMKEKIIAETIRMIAAGGNKPEDINFREICANLNIALGLINYHFGSKKNLVNACAQKMIDGIVSNFEKIRDSCDFLPPYEKLRKLSIMTLDYLFENQNLSKLSINVDCTSPTLTDNTSHTIRAYLPLMKLCKPNFSDREIQIFTYNLVFSMQNLFTRAEIINSDLGINLFDKAQRDAFHNEMLSAIIGE